MRRTIIILTLILTTFSVSVGQTFKKDLENGLYQSIPDWIFVHQLISDTLKGFKLIESKPHFEKVSKALFDSIPNMYLSPQRKQRGNPNKVIDILKISKDQYSIVYKIDSGYSTLNFFKRHIGYEMCFSKHKVEKKDLVKSITQDTTNYFKYYVFTLTDLKKLRKLKNLNDITQSDFEGLLDYMETNRDRFWTQINKSGVQKSLYATIESNEIRVKIFLELGYNPIIMPEDFDAIYKKYYPNKRYKPKR